MTRHLYTGDTTARYVTTARYSVADVLVGLTAETGSPAERAAALAQIGAWPMLRWDAVRAYMRDAELVEIHGQWHHLTRAGRRFQREARHHQI